MAQKKKLSLIEINFLLEALGNRTLVRGKEGEVST